MNIKPTLVLTVVTTVIAALLIAAHNLTYVDTSGIITDKLRAKCEELMGSGEYSIITDWQTEGYLIDKPDSIQKLIRKDDGRLASQHFSQAVCI